VSIELFGWRLERHAKQLPALLKDCPDYIRHIHRAMEIYEKDRHARVGAGECGMTVDLIRLSEIRTVRDVVLHDYNLWRSWSWKGMGDPDAY
jgi:hypothetical protein